MTEIDIIQAGFIFTGKAYVKSFNKYGITCICAITPQKRINRHFKRRPKMIYILAISSLGESNDCFTKQVSNIAEVESICRDFDPLSKKVNNLLLKFFVVIAVVLLAVFLLK